MWHACIEMVHFKICGTIFKHYKEVQVMPPKKSFIYSTYLLINISTYLLYILYIYIIIYNISIYLLIIYIYKFRFINIYRFIYFRDTTSYIDVYRYLYRDVFFTLSVALMARATLKMGKFLSNGKYIRSWSILAT